MKALWLRLSGEIIQIFSGKLEMTCNDDLYKQLTFNKRYCMKVIHETLEIDYLSEASQQPGELQALLYRDLRLAEIKRLASDASGCTLWLCNLSVSNPLRVPFSKANVGTTFWSWVWDRGMKLGNSVLKMNFFFFLTSLVVQKIRICPPMQGAWIWSLVREDSTCYGATNPVCHWACALRPGATATEALCCSH